MKFFSTNIIRQLDEYTIEHEPISSLDLMERAAQALFTEFTSRFSTGKEVFVFAGQGNNGGDAMALARLLLHAGYRVTTYLFNPISSEKTLSVECETNRNRLFSEYPETFFEIRSEFMKPEITTGSIVIDGLFGSGLTRPLEGGFAAVVDFINHSEGYVVAIDIPSGMMGEENIPVENPVIVEAELTLSLQFPKLAFFLSENSRFIGEWKVLDIQLHPEAIEQTPSNLYYQEAKDIQPLLKKRSRFAHKGEFGHVLLVAGRTGMAGAAVLAAKATLRSGAGLVTVHSAAANCQILQTAVPEVIFQPDKSADYITEIISPDYYNIVAVGPGISTRSEAAIMLRKLLSEVRKPMVIDADALNIIANQKDLLPLIPKNSILTPHVKEFERIFGQSKYSYERIAKAQKAARQLGVIIVLKGAHTLIATPERNLIFNSSGNPGMATAGAGDVLTGILTGLLAQGYEPEDAARLGVYLHGIAGDLALKCESEESLIAGDIVASLGEAFRALKRWRINLHSFRP